MAEENKDAELSRLRKQVDAVIKERDDAKGRLADEQKKFSELERQFGLATAELERIRKSSTKVDLPEGAVLLDEAFTFPIVSKPEKTYDGKEKPPVCVDAKPGHILAVAKDHTEATPERARAIAEQAGVGRRVHFVSKETIQEAIERGFVQQQ